MKAFGRGRVLVQLGCDWCKAGMTLVSYQKELPHLNQGTRVKLSALKIHCVCRDSANSGLRVPI